MSSGAMVACCAHHLSDILPVVGGSAALFLNDVKTPLAVLGMALNAGGVAYMVGRIRSVRSLRCAGPVHQGAR
jgi:hypothetical protein